MEMHWIVGWINKEPAISDIWLHDFWKSHLFSETGYPMVSEESPEKNMEEFLNSRGSNGASGIHFKREANDRDLH
jgi:hypothetical protein